MKQKIIPIIVVLLLAGLGAWKYYDFKHPKPVTAQTEQTVSTKDGIVTTGPVNVKGSSVNVTEGKSTNESNFILGFIAGYKKKEKEDLESEEVPVRMKMEMFIKVRGYEETLRLYPEHEVMINELKELL